MFKALLKKISESTVSVLPVTAIVLLLSATPLLDLTLTEGAVFACSALVLIAGMALFNLGADIAMTPMGEQIGSGHRFFRPRRQRSRSCRRNSCGG